MVREFWFILAVLHSLSMKAGNLNIAEALKGLYLSQSKFSSTFLTATLGFSAQKAKGSSKHGAGQFQLPLNT